MKILEIGTNFQGTGDSLVSKDNIWYRMDDEGFESRQGKKILLISKTSTSGLGLSQPPIQRAQVLRRPGFEVTIPPRLLPRISASADILRSAHTA